MIMILLKTKTQTQTHTYTSIVLAFFCCSDKLPQTQLLKIIQSFYLTVLNIRRPKSVSAGKNQDVNRAAFLLEALRRICFLLFSSFWWLPAFLGSQPHPPSSKSIAQHVPVSPWDSDPPYKHHCDYIGSTQIIQNHLFISRSLTELRLQNPFCCIK